MVAGARALAAQTGQALSIAAGAVVLAAGGCAFQSETLGCDVNTGDGALLAVEVGADLSGMEFSNAYAIAPAGTSLTKTAYYSCATFYRADGTVLEGAGSTRGRSVIAATLLDRARATRGWTGPRPTCSAPCARASPTSSWPSTALGIDPFTDLFAITLLAEGTVRGTGGVRIAGDDCSTSVPGLYAAGDAATRELICGGFTGGGSHNAAWAASSGSWAGRCRRRLRGTARRRPDRGPAGGAAGLRPAGARRLAYREVVGAGAARRPALRPQLRAARGQARTRARRAAPRPGRLSATA